MKRAVYFCLLLLSWAPHARGTQTNLSNRMGRLRNLQGVVMDIQNLPVTDTVVRLWSDPERHQMVLEGKTDEEGRFRLHRDFTRTSRRFRCRAFLLQLDW